MKINSIKITILSLLSILFMAGCDSDDSAFSGTDNLISSFVLTQGERSFSATISNDSIEITVPSGFTLNGATAKYTISENAKISPDPATITDWSANQIFKVTSYNGTSRSYKYVVKIGTANVISEGDVVLLTQEDVAAFAALGINTLKGNLTIGQTTGSDSIKSFALLSNLVTVEKGVTINPTYAGTNLAGFDNLIKVGSLNITKIPNLKEVSFPALQNVVLDLSLSNNANLEEISFPELITINNTGLSITKVTLMSFPKLESVYGNLSLSSNTIMDKISFPTLKTIGGTLSISGFSKTESLDFPLLEDVDEFTLSGVASVKNLLFPKLKNIHKRLYWSGLSNLSVFDFSSLVNVEGNFPVPTCSTGNGIKLNSLVTVSGTLTINGSGADNMAELLPVLQNVKTLILNAMPNLAEVDLRTMEVGTLQIGKSVNIYKIIGNEICNSNISFGSSTFKAIPELSGIKELGGLTISSCNNITAAVISSISKIHGSLTISNNNLCDEIEMPNLSEIDGDVSFTNTYASSLDFSKLETIKGGFGFSSAIPKGSTFDLSFPALKSVGYLDISTIASSSGMGMISNISFSSLTTIDTYLRILSNYSNNQLINLDGLSKLASIGSNVTITGNKALVSFEGLKNAISSFTGTWAVSGNAYNPTLDDMKADRWSNP